jgi:hypothetical protein
VPHIAYSEMVDIGMAEIQQRNKCDTAGVKDVICRPAYVSSKRTSGKDIFQYATDPMFLEADSL